MIDHEVLKSVKHIVTHEDCPDGLGSALILKDVLPKATLDFIRYNSPEHLNLPVREGTLFCDIIPHQTQAQAFREVGAVVLDHHKHAKDVVLSFGERGIFADEVKDPGVSGAVLAYREVWSQIVSEWDMDSNGDRIQGFAELVGIRDTFYKKTPELWRAACGLSEVLRFYPREMWFSNPRSFWILWDKHVALGEVLLLKNEERCHRTLKTAFRGVVAGRRVVIFQGTHTSDEADLLGAEADVVLGFKYLVEDQAEILGWSERATMAKGPKLSISCRSSTGSVDVGAMAKSFGGGGHTKAAGFSLRIQAGEINPYQHLIRTLIEYFSV